MKSKIIVIEGLDGSGKATQTKILCEKISALGKKVTKLEFPNYESPAAAPVKMYLDGEFGDKPDDVNAYAASAFYAVDRVASYLQFWKKECDNGGVILSDRYVTSNIIYQMSKLPKEEWNSFIDWLNDFEYEKLGIPKPDLVMHEKNLRFLLDCRKSAVYAAKKCGWKVINCCENGEIKSIEKISEEIERAAAEIYAEL